MDDDSMKKPRFNPEINYGAIMQALVFAFMFVGFAMQQSSWQTKIDERVAAISTAMAKIDAIIMPVVTANTVQDERITRLGTSVTELRAINTGLSVQLTGIREDLAAIKTKLGTK